MPTSKLQGEIIALREKESGLHYRNRFLIAGKMAGSRLELGFTRKALNTKKTIHYQVSPW